MGTSSEGGKKGEGEEVSERGARSEGGFEKNEPGTHLEPVQYIHKLADCILPHFSTISMATSNRCSFTCSSGGICSTIFPHIICSLCSYLQTWVGSGNETTRNFSMRFKFTFYFRLSLLAAGTFGFILPNIATTTARGTI